MPLLTKVKETINRYGLLSTGDRVLVAVSGGPDSLALLHILKRLKKDYDLDLHIFHLDHMLRGEEAIADAEFVKQIARQWEVPITVERYDVKSYQQRMDLSLEEAAREVRYELLFNQLEELNLTKIAVGHHANDQAETILMNLIRGAGLKGLAGIAPKRDQIIRPLFELTKQEINEYCQRYNLQPRLDETNLETIYYRNKVRLELLPLLIEEYNSNLINTLQRTAEILDKEEDFLQQSTKKIMNELLLEESSQQLIISKERFSKLHLALQRRVIKRALKLLSGQEQGFYYHHIESILEFILTGQTGTQIDLPYQIVVALNYEEVSFRIDKAAVRECNYFEHKLSLGQNRLVNLGLTVKAKVVGNDYQWREEINDPNKAHLDFSKIGSEFYLRQRQDGDRFYPLGMKGSKKVKDFLIDEKVLISIRDEIPIFTTLQGEIFWIGRLRVDERFKITEETEKILIIEIVN
ncbi:tRNA lysidine(34) synthetase TilS [Natroniella sulfidigena]|uniref:tRNA lysidine(34) synthetase TilS n=1 Tax=Natroniella sulfidigena TaxID=723921 RepID=UPI00200A870C|nr:tRNA lysidine(34) synthetase TilS [Natroniella sulfidigena]MCK8816999.1 tRNA lysidine(34) synthetase TilS [Natroniella sulfidigena]